MASFIDPRYVVRTDLRQAELIDAIRWLCTEMPADWVEIATGEGREEVVETVSRALMDEVPDELYEPYCAPTATERRLNSAERRAAVLGRLQPRA